VWPALGVVPLATVVAPLELNSTDAPPLTTEISSSRALSGVPQMPLEPLVSMSIVPSQSFSR
jgi:hypothetical protein